MRSLRDYQRDARAAHDKALTTHRSTLLLMATGLGKTVVMSDIAKNRSEDGVVLMLAHRIELLDQAAKRFEPDLGYLPQIVQADREVYWPSIGGGQRVLIGSVQTLRREKRLNKLIHAVECHGTKVVHLLIDEAHHATAPSYRTVEKRLLEHNADMKTTGVTATVRADKKALGLSFESEGFKMEANEGIDKGWLVDADEQRIIVEGVDFEKIEMSTNEAGEVDFDPAQLDAMMSEEGPLWAVAKPILDHGDKKALVFTAGVNHAHLLARLLNREKKDSAVALDGKTTPPGHPDRVKAIKEFSTGDLQYLVNYSLFTEGFDAPECQMVVIARPTKSLTVLIQMVGRGLRPLPGVVDKHTSPIVRKAAIAESAKPFATILYFIPKAANIKCVNTFDALGGNYDDETKELAKKMAEEEEGGKVTENLKKAAALQALLSEDKARKLIKAKVEYRKEKVGEYAPDGAGNDVSNINRGGCDDQAIEKLLGMGVSYEKAASFGQQQAYTVLNKLRDEKCSLKQKKTLKKHGLDTTMNFHEARKAIDKLAANGWKAATS